MISEQTDYKNDVMICFWYSIEKGLLNQAQKVFKLDPIIGIIMKDLRRNGAQAIEERKHKND